MNNYTITRAKPIDEPDLITVLCPTRSRPELLDKAVALIDRHTSRKDQVNICLLVDNDDLPTCSLIHSGWSEKFDIKVSCLIDDPTITLGDGLNKLWQSAPNGGIYVYMGDDHQMLTSNWDLTLRDTFDSGPKDRCLIAQIRDLRRTSEDLIIWAVTAEWLNTIGRFVPPYFPFWFIDMWVDHVSIMAGRKVKSGIEMESVGGEGHGTQNLWNLAYWYRFFHLLLFERVQEAHKILHNTGKNPTAAHSQTGLLAEHHLQNYENWAMSQIDERKLSQVQRDNLSGDSQPDERSKIAVALAHEYFQSVWPQIQKFGETRQIDSMKDPAL